MTYANQIPASRTPHAADDHPADELGLLLIDDEFDDFLDRELFALRDSLADFRSL